MADRLNTVQIRDFLDYIEAEAMAGVFEQARGGTTHPDMVAGLGAFIEKYDVQVPVTVTQQELSPAKRRRIQEGFLRDWRAHQAALRTLRPLMDLVLAVADGRSSDEQVALHNAAFPSATRALSS